MAENFNDLSRIRHVQAGDPVAAKQTSQPTRAIEIRLQQLEEQFRALSQSSEFSKLIIRNVPIRVGDQAVTQDAVVYYNPNTGLYELAVAGVTFMSGIYQFNPTALALGICIAVRGSIGDVMIAGYDTWRDADQGNSHAQSMIDPLEDFVPGVPYFLSAQVPGKLTRFPPSLRIQIMVATAHHYVLETLYGNPDSLDTPVKQPMGMRPVGSLRRNQPSGEQQVIVAFDALELFTLDNQHSGYGQWRLTADNDDPSNSTLRDFGYMIADATVVSPPAVPLYIRIRVEPLTGSITMCEARTLAGADFAADGLIVSSTAFTPLADNKDLLRTCSIFDIDGTTVLGSLSFKFTTNKVDLRRDVIFKFPDSFQGWKMINAPVSPLARAIVSGGKITDIIMQERGVGYDTPPVVSITGDGVGATAVAILDDYGSIAQIQFTSGSGYTQATVEFLYQLTSVVVANGGSGAIITASLTASPGPIMGLNVVAGGSGYTSPPSVQVVDASGAGEGAIVYTTVRNGVVVAATLADPGQLYVAPVLIVRPNGNQGYQVTTEAVLIPTVSNGAIGAVVISDGGCNHPLGTRLQVLGAGVGAVLVPTLDEAGAIVDVTINQPGSGYLPETTTIAIVDVKDPLVACTGYVPSVTATQVVNLSSMYLSEVRILTSGIGYAPTSTIAFSAPDEGTTAIGRLVLDSAGRIIRINITNPGTGYTSPPTYTITDSGGLGNGATLSPVVSSYVDTVTVDSPGSGYMYAPEVFIACPVDHIEIEEGGTGYTTPPDVHITEPDIAGAMVAAATAVLGGTIISIFVTNSGSGYTVPGNWEIQLEGNATAVPVFSGGELVAVEVIDPGDSYAVAPVVTLHDKIGGSAGSGAAALAIIEGVGSVVRVDLTNQGTGYIAPPYITLLPLPSESGIQAVASAKLMGSGAQIQAYTSGNGGLRYPQTAALLTGNNLQVYNFNDDLNDSATAVLRRPNNAVFYYNIKADPALGSQYPSIPPEKSLFVLNGTELLGTFYSESSGISNDLNADVVLNRKTVFWTSFDTDACPWDAGFQNYLIDLGTGGTDHIIPASGPYGYTDSWFRFWESVYKYQAYRNRGWLHLNRGSRFYQTGRVSSVAVLAPLRIFDVTTGTEIANDGTPATGQLAIMLDNQSIFLTGNTGVQLDLKVANNLQVIYKNDIGRPVMVTSVVMIVVYQVNSNTGAPPSVAYAAKITVGTQAGNYRDIIGTIDPTAAVQAGADTKLYAQNQVKELFPDARDSAPLIMPNESVYLRVENPAGTLIKTQLVMARVRGYVF